MIFLIGLAYCEPLLLAVSNVTGHIRKKTDRLDRQIGLPSRARQDGWIMWLSIGCGTFPLINKRLELYNVKKRK